MHWHPYSGPTNPPFEGAHCLPGARYFHWDDSNYVLDEVDGNKLRIVLLPVVFETCFEYLKNGVLNEGKSGLLPSQS